MEKPVLLPENMAQAIVAKLEILATKIEKKTKQTELPLIMDNTELIQLFNISYKTSKRWRDEGIIAYIQIGAKIFFKVEDVKKLIKNNYINNQ